MRKFTRSISGVAPVVAMAPPLGCPGHCIYCPTFPSIPQSYTPGSPAALRAKTLDYLGGRQVGARLGTLQAMGHVTDKVELIVMGGTFLAYPVDYQYDFIKDCFDGLNGKASASLEEAKLINERAQNRCVGLCIETRPDYCGQAEMDRMLQFGTTRVELGVQTLDDEIYELVRRGHEVRHVIQATRLLKDHGFKVYYHWMPGLPGLDPDRDLELFARLFSDERFRPDGLKLYPTLVVEGTELERWYRAQKYQPYSMEELVGLMIKMKALVPRYVRISRVMRDIPAQFIVAGCTLSHLRDELKKEMKKRGAECKCIRCREYGHRLRDGWRVGEPKLRRQDYGASGGKEVFLSFEDEGETLFALLRMRISASSPVGQIDGNSALIRELHVFGPEVPLKHRTQIGAQHKGLGEALLREAERVAREEFGAGKMTILSGVGAKEYFRSKFAYRCQGPYLTKEL